MIKVSSSGKTIRATVDLTPSKSITSRVLIINALSEKKIDLINLASANDSKILTEALSELPPVIDVNDAGTAFRFLTAYLSVTPGSFILKGSERMKNRPVGKLVNALKEIGAEIEFLEKENFPPLKINGKALKGGKISIDASESSQFISALLLIAPYLTEGLKLELIGKINSRPYIVMTLSLMQFFGINITTETNYIHIPFQQYSSKSIRIENDWSSASFWYLAAALSEKAEITMKNLFPNSIQGDSVIAEIMKSFGITTEFVNGDVVIRKDSDAGIPSAFEYDFSSCPDLVMPVAVLCSSLKIPSEFRGVKNLRIKESDRLQSLKTELEKTGADVLINDDSFKIEYKKNIQKSLVFNSHNDHRIAMSLALLSLKYDEVFIDDHLVVNKSYPEFWRQMRSAGFSCELT